ncbi:hypothetical protein [Aliiglaciecola sp. LCG003]|uniref:hypothetical protein n=1 Tax=Aliiglaciecola sp. LCG003 TaxID=3053655 RepID=UPI0025748D03|nr:hypothetical protein [Aliiglaciecola sp. LCG003]WJG10321.1 hypothetical protein QR722_04600 [Aliiglaciecola sp. LCG003]
MIKAIAKTASVTLFVQSVLTYVLGINLLPTSQPYTNMLILNVVLFGLFVLFNRADSEQESK